MQPGGAIFINPDNRATVTLDFMKDLADVFRHELGRLGCTFDPNADVNRLGIMFFNTRYRRVETRAREVHESRELRRKIARSDGLTRVEKVGLRRLKEKFWRGRDVQPHLSTLTAKAGKKDGLLFDWGVHHFHLGIEPYDKNPRFVDRTPPVLLACLREEHVYLLDVLDHHALDNVIWAEKALLEIMLDNWPALVEPHKIHGILGLETEPTSLEHGQLRAAGITTLVKLSDGSIYAPPGGGIMSSKDSTWSVMSLNACMKNVAHWESWVRQNAAQKAGAARKAGLQVGLDLHFEMYVENSTAYARERRSGLRIPLGTLP